MNATQRDAWLEDRRTGIGSSDVPAILGVSPYADATPLNVYLDKIGRAARGRMPAPLEWGHRLEPAIAGAITDHYGWPLRKVGLQRHAEHPWLLASCDRLNHDGQVCEIKSSTSHEGWGEPDTEEVPNHVWFQVQHQLEVVNSHRPGDPCQIAWVFVLLNGSDFRRYWVGWNPEFLAVVMPTLRAFWDCVESRTPPDVKWDSPGDVAAARRIPTDPGTSVGLGGEAAQLADLYEGLGREISTLKKQRDEVQARIVQAMGHSERGLLPDGRQVRRATRERKGYAVEPTTYTDFRILTPRGEDRGE